MGVAARAADASREVGSIGCSNAPGAKQSAKMEVLKRGTRHVVTTRTEELNSTKRNTNTNNYNESENKPPLSTCNSFLSLELSVKFLESTGHRFAVVV